MSDTENGVEESGGGTTRGEWKETVSGESIVVWCPECGDPMHLSGSWKHEVEITVPQCPDCYPGDWIDHADVKIHPKEAEALVEYDG